MQYLASAKPQLTGSILAREGVGALGPVWIDLARRAVEDNAYYCPTYVEALLQHVTPAADLQFATAWENERLIGLLPFVRPARGVALIGGHGSAWHTGYTFSCTPLLNKEAPTDAAAVLIEQLATCAAGEWVVPHMNTDGAACKAFVAALERAGRPWAFINSFQRASIELGPSFETHVRTRIAPNRRKSLERNRKRLAALGTVKHRIYYPGPDLHEAVLTFLKIEASGWKGRAGTALDCLPATRQFALQAFCRSDPSLRPRVDALVLDGKPVAMIITLCSGRTAFGVKCSYDENYRSYSVGLLLELDVLRTFLTERWADRMDGGTSGTHVVDSIWCDRVEVADLLFSLAPHHAATRLRWVAAVQQGKHAFKQAAKQVIGLI